MNEKKTDLSELLERVKAATGPDRELDADVYAALLGGEVQWRQAFGVMEMYPVARRPSDSHVGGYEHEQVPIYTASVDASLALAGRLMPHHRFALFTDGQGRGPCCLVLVGDDPVVAQEFAPTLPLAILTALLSALSKADKQ